MLRFLRTARAQVVLLRWRHPPESDGPGRLHQQLGSHPHWNPRTPPGLGGPGKKRRSDVQPDDHEEHLAHSVSLLRPHIGEDLPWASSPLLGQEVGVNHLVAGSQASAQARS